MHLASAVFKIHFCSAEYNYIDRTLLTSFGTDYKSVMVGFNLVSLLCVLVRYMHNLHEFRIRIAVKNSIFHITDVAS